MISRALQVLDRALAGCRAPRAATLVLVVLTAVVALATSGCGTSALPPSAPSAKLGEPLPDFKRPTVDGSMVDTRSLRGRVVIVKFFAKYCEPCKKTLPAAQRLSLSRPDVAVIGIAEDEDRSDIDEMIAAYQLTFPIVHDRDNLLAGSFRVNEMPVAFVADRGGVIRWVASDKHDEDDLEKAVDAAAQ